MFFYSFFIIVFLFILYLLFTPIIINIDTKTNQYYTQLKGIGKASIETHDNEIFQIKLQTIFFNHYYFPLRKKPSSKHRKSLKKSKMTKVPSITTLNTGLRILRTIEVKKLFIDIDTGNCITNAQWYPIFAFMNYRFGEFHVNFENRNQLVLQMQNRPIDIIKAFINI